LVVAGGGRLVLQVNHLSTSSLQDTKKRARALISAGVAFDVDGISKTEKLFGHSLSAGAAAGGSSSYRGLLFGGVAGALDVLCH